MRFLGLALLVVLAGCSSAAPPLPPAAPPAVPPATSAPPPTSSPAVQVNDKLKFTATTVDGKAFDGASLAGKPTVLWFWAAWCPKCKGDAAAIRDLQASVAGRVNVVGIAGLRSGSDGMKTFVSTYKLTGFPQLADDSGEVWKRFEVPSQHYYVVLDPAGNVIHRGPLSIDQLKQKIGA